jgi:AraC-like DNA-binding protein
MSPKHYDMQLIKEVHYQITHSILVPLNLTMLISETNISAATFIKYYKEMYDKTPAQHRLQVMMQYAESQLKEGIPVKKVAYDLGYSTAQNFSRVFKKIVGHPPSKRVQD